MIHIWLEERGVAATAIAGSTGTAGGEVSDAGVVGAD
jgi:hypothetical protein